MVIDRGFPPLKLIAKPGRAVPTHDTYTMQIPFWQVFSPILHIFWRPKTLVAQRKTLVPGKGAICGTRLFFHHKIWCFIVSPFGVVF